jgi:hypothetical protein
MFFIKDILLKKLKASRVNNKIVVEILESMKIFPLLGSKSIVDRAARRPVFDWIVQFYRSRGSVQCGSRTGHRKVQFSSLRKKI